MYHIRVAQQTFLSCPNPALLRFRDWSEREHETWSDNAYKIFDPNHKKCTIDIPKEFRSFDNYR